MINIEELERLLQRAAPDKWFIQGAIGAPQKQIRRANGSAVADVKNSEEATLIAAAVNSLPELIARVRSLERMLKLLDQDISDGP